MGDGVVDYVAGYLAVADGVIVGSSLKIHAPTGSPVDLDRVKAFMAVSGRAPEG